MKFDRSNKFDLCYYGQVNSLRLKSNVVQNGQTVQYGWTNKCYPLGVTFILLVMLCVYFHIANLLLSIDWAINFVTNDITIAYLILRIILSMPWYYQYIFLATLIHGDGLLCQTGFTRINWMFGSVPHRLFMHCIPKAAGYFIDL